MTGFILLLKKKRSLLIVSSLIPLNPLESEIIFNRIINLTISESTLSPTPQACDFKRLVCNLTKSFSQILKF